MENKNRKTAKDEIDKAVFRDRFLDVIGDDTIVTVAMKTGIDQSAVSNLINDEKKAPSLLNLLLISKAYGCSIDYLLGLSDKKEIQKDRPEQEKKRLTFRDVARMLVEIDEGFHFTTKTDLYQSHMSLNSMTGIAEHSEKDVLLNTLVTFGLVPDLANYAIRVPIDDELLTRPAFVEVEQPGPTAGYIKLNQFFSDYITLRDATRKEREDTEIFDKEIWKDLIEKKLLEVPEDPAPYPRDKSPYPPALFD